MGLFSKKVSRDEFDALVGSIKNSFSNVKTDISKIKDHKDPTNKEDQIKEIHNIIGYLNQSLKVLNNKVDAIELQPKIRMPRIQVRDIEPEELEIPETKFSTQQQIDKDSTGVDKGYPLIPKRLLDKLTTVQEEMLKRLAALNRENPNTQVSAKDLAYELYPETEYSKVRPMISNYLDILEELNLIKKIRKRRQVYAELTEKGNSILQSYPTTKIKFSKSTRNVRHKRKKI